jgi:hypothetical protein
MEVEAVMVDNLKLKQTILAFIWSHFDRPGTHSLILWIKPQ